MSVRILPGDCRAVLKTLPDESVHCCVCSPPYFGLRAYLPDGHPDKAKEIGLEPTPAAYVAELVSVFREVRRVLRADSTCWLNLGDSFSNKQLLGIPWRVAFALQDDGWWLRSDIIWAKKNCMPESCTDRPTKSHEYLFLLTKSERYYFDNIAIAERCEPQVSKESSRESQTSCLQEEHREQENSRTLAQVGIGAAFVEEISEFNKAQTSSEEALRQRAADSYDSTISSDTQRSREFAEGHTQTSHENDSYSVRLNSGAMGENKIDSGLQVPPLSARETANQRPYSATVERRTTHGGQYSGPMPQLQQSKEQQSTYRNRRTVWFIATEPFRESHFAVMPTALIEPCILAGCPAKCCAKCGAPWIRVIESGPGLPRERGELRNVPPGTGSDGRNNISGATHAAWKAANPDKFLGFSPSCKCNAGTVPGTCLDPFFGAGTTGLVSDRLQRNCIGVELNPDYVAMSRKRVDGDAPLFAEAAE